MCEAVHMEWRESCRGMDSVNQRKCNVREHQTPSPWRLSSNTVKHITKDSINSLSLTICLRIILCGHVQSRAKHLKMKVQNFPVNPGSRLEMIAIVNPFWRKTRSINSISVLLQSMDSGTAADPFFLYGQLIPRFPYYRHILWEGITQIHADELSTPRRYRKTS